jgi:heme-degrading monooxygenase HmoA
MPPETHFVAVHQIFEVLRAIPGCRGVELAHSESGRHSILAWFEDKEALANWYYSDFHKNLQRTYYPEEIPGPLLANVPYRGGPIIAIASFGLDEKMDPAAPMLAIRDITVDLFSPLSADTLLGTKVNGESPDR